MIDVMQAAKHGLPIVRFGVQAFSTQRSHPALGDRVCLWRPERRANLGDAEGPHQLVEDRTIAPVSIVDEKARWLSIPAAALDGVASRSIKLVHIDRQRRMVTGR